MKSRTLARLAIAATAVVAPLVAGIGAPTSASASTVPVLSLASGTTVWSASGSGYTPGISGVQLWVQDVTGGSWTTLEYQGGLTTSTFAPYHCFNGPPHPFCTFSLAGHLSARGAEYWVTAPPGGFGNYWQANHPMACGHSYQAVSHDASDGWTYSNVLVEPACPRIG